MCRLLRAVVVLVLMIPALVPALVMAQAQVPAGYDEGPTRVLQIEQIEGSVSVQRGGRTVALQSGFLVFNDERVMLAPESRASLLLARHGHLEFQPESGPGALTVQKLPFSSWAVNLETALRVDSGALRVRWMRPANADEWPLEVLLGPWRAQLGNGEFLFRSAAHAAEVCNVSGAITVVDESAAWRGPVPVGQCLALREGETPAAFALVGASWTGLTSVVSAAPAQAAAAETRQERALSALPQGKKPAASGESARPVVTPPPAVVAPSPAVQVPAPQTPAAPAVAEVSPRKPEVPAVVAPSAAEPPPVIPEPSPPGEAVVIVPASPLEPEVPSQAAAITPPPSTPVAAAPEAAPSNIAPPVSMRRLAESSAMRESAATPAPANAVAMVPAETAPSGPEWIVNVMTVTDPKVADEHLQRLTTAGYPAQLRSETVRGRASYRVIVPGLSSDQAATRMVDLLRRNLGYTAAWSLQKR